MNSEIKGLKEVLQQLEKMDSNMRNKTAKLAIETASEEMLSAIKTTAPRAKVKSTRSYSFLNKTIKKNGGVYRARMGINKDNWEHTRGLNIAPLYSNI